MAKKKATKRKSANGSEPKYRSFRLEKKIVLPPHGMPSILQNTRDTLKFLFKHKRTFSAMLALHFLFYVVFFRASSQLSIAELQELFSTLFAEASTVETQVTVATEAFGIKVDDLAAQNPFAIICVSIISSLAIIWAIRHKHAAQKFSIKEPYYNGMHALFPYTILMLLVIIQSLPFALGATIFSTVTTSVSTTGIEQILLGLLWAGATTVSGYWLTLTGLAMYAVTLQGVTPVEALRGMKLTLQHRRLAAFVRVLGFFVLMAVALFALLLLTIFAARDLAFLFIDVFFVLTPFLYHTYLYKLYKSIL